MFAPRAKFSINAHLGHLKISTFQLLQILHAIKADDWVDGAPLIPEACLVFQQVPSFHKPLSVICDHSLHDHVEIGKQMTIKRNSRRKIPGPETSVLRKRFTSYCIVGANKQNVTTPTATHHSHLILDTHFKILKSHE